MENNTAQYPVNQWTVAGEPVVSKNHGARRIEWSHIKINIHTFTGQKFYRQSYGLSDNGIRCPIKQLQLDRVYGICREFIILNKAGIHKAVSGTRVNKCGNTERRVGNKLWSMCLWILPSHLILPYLISSISSYLISLYHILYL